MEPDLFFAGVRPAVNVGISVSRVGGNAQRKGMKKIAGSLRLDLPARRKIASGLSPLADSSVSERWLEMQEARIGDTSKSVLDQTVRQMNEPPGARLRVGLSTLTMAGYGDRRGRGPGA